MVPCPRANNEPQPESPSLLWLQIGCRLVADTRILLGLGRTGWTTTIQFCLIFQTVWTGSHSLDGVETFERRLAPAPNQWRTGQHGGRSRAFDGLRRISFGGLIFFIGFFHSGGITSSLKSQWKNERSVR